MTFPELITECSIVLTRYGCLVIHFLALCAGFSSFSLWLGGIVVRNTIGLKAFYDAYATYLKARKP